MSQLSAQKNQELLPLRAALLELHRELIEFERRKYEAMYGRVPVATSFLTVVTNHPAFSWLRSLSELIVTIDELLEEKEERNEFTKKHFLDFVEKLLTLEEGGDTFSRKYQVAIQEYPEAAYAHGKVTKEVRALRV